MSSEEIDTKTKILEASWRLLEAHQGQGVKMSDIAKEAGISRQAVYLHFASRTELMIATMNYVDEVKGLDARLAQLNNTTSGTELLSACVEVWGNYIPEIYGLAKAMLMTRDTDKDMAAAWNNSMNCLRDVCQNTIEALDKEGKLTEGWSIKEATDMFMATISISQWEQLTIECGWSNEQYVSWTKFLLLRTFVR